MSGRYRVLVGVLAAVAATAVAGRAAFATTSYPDYFGPDVAFTGIQETARDPDPEPLFGAPTGVGNQLLFFPANFAAGAGGGGGDVTGAQLQVLLTATNPGGTLDSVMIGELGNFEMQPGFPELIATFVEAVLVGSLIVTETLSGPIAPLSINFGASFGAVELATPEQLWSASAVIDIESVVPDATKAILSLDNFLRAGSDPSCFPHCGGIEPAHALIRKNEVSITVIPEPGTFTLLGGGLLALSLRARRRRA